MDREPKELTRAELHALVWETPMIRLADQFGISGNGLAKICRRLAVPYPPRGWWAKRAAGKPIKTEPLPPAPPGVPERIRISRTPAEPEGLKAAILEKRNALGEVVVPKRLTRPHPLIAGWIEDHRNQMEKARRQRDAWYRSLYAVSDYTETDRRRHRTLHALFQVLERHGASVSENERRQLIATVCGEEIEFSLQEKSKQVTRPMTAEETRRESWNTSGIKKELQPTGHLQFSIKIWLDQAFRKSWLESDRRSLDAVLAEIAATFLVLGPELAERARVRREEARIFAERQAQLELERQRRRQDENRWKRFLEIAEAWQRAELARTFVVRLRQLESAAGDGIDSMSVVEWLDWAERCAHQFDPLGRGIGPVFDDIARINAWSYPR